MARGSAHSLKETFGLVGEDRTVSSMASRRPFSLIAPSPHRLPLLQTSRNFRLIKMKVGIHARWFRDSCSTDCGRNELRGSLASAPPSLSAQWKNGSAMNKGGKEYEW